MVKFKKLSAKSVFRKEGWNFISVQHGNIYFWNHSCANLRFIWSANLFISIFYLKFL